MVWACLIECHVICCFLHHHYDDPLRMFSMKDLSKDCKEGYSKLLQSVRDKLDPPKGKNKITIGNRRHSCAQFVSCFVELCRSSVWKSSCPPRRILPYFYHFSPLQQLTRRALRLFESISIKLIIYRHIKVMQTCKSYQLLPGAFERAPSWFFN